MEEPEEAEERGLGPEELAALEEAAERGTLEALEAEERAGQEAARLVRARARALALLTGKLHPNTSESHTMNCGRSTSRLKSLGRTRPN